MPGFDGTGPLGRGSMTGGGRGNCMVPLTRTNFAQQPTTSANDTSAQKVYAGGGFLRRGLLSGGGLESRRGGRRASNRKFW